MAEHEHKTEEKHDDADLEPPGAAEHLPDGTRPFALVGYFETPGQLYHACEQVKEAGFKQDAHTPFPVHGLEKAMGLPPSKLPWIVLGHAFLGGTGIFALMAWVHAIDYPQNISGKVLFAWQAYVPVTFEITVLLSAFGAFFGMWALNRLPQLFHPVMQHPSFERASDDRFFISIETEDEAVDIERARALLKKLGAHEVMEVAP
jgi:hypothetical protein